MQACQWPHFESDKFSQTAFSPLLVQGQPGRRGLSTKTWPPWPPSCSTVQPRQAIRSQLLGHARGDVAQGKSLSPGSGEPILEAVTFGHATPCCLVLPGSGQVFRGTPSAAEDFCSALGCPPFLFQVMPPLPTSTEKTIHDEPGPFL